MRELLLLAEKPVGPRDLAKLLGRTSDVVQRAPNGLVAPGEAVREEGGKYRLALAGDD